MVFLILTRKLSLKSGVADKNIFSDTQTVAHNNPELLSINSNYVSTVTSPDCVASYGFNNMGRMGAVLYLGDDGNLRLQIDGGSCYKIQMILDNN